ncbi:Soluble lytic murein transglycosylase [Planktothrix tepida]|uniref:Lytic transglycosylase, catalytic n=2 Tax=Planktothrix TaxID=54304 RepID=A0A1J1LLR6_9CYAN|nr:MULTISPECIES: transglycosylase SLT domain-containing protein [Planktothrix]CAD5936405.1 Soluble lytic murein transglycosylase [Planktothrix tepida]CAD5975098.1 Soluble lytic murein transglycosylase [Planktothrix pseudagardhii]CUR33403.1 Lytic transglycosylase, catalytic [Planktothrix tepida PCC 9214]
MIKRRISKVWILPAIASGALLVGVFFPLTQFQEWKKSFQQSPASVSQIPESEVLKLALLPVSQRQPELEAIAKTKNDSLETSRARYLLASDSLKENPETALKLLEGLEKDYPLLAGQILVKRAQAYEQMGESEKAEKTWQELLANYGDQPVVVEALFALGKTNPQYWDQAIAKFPSHPRTLEIAQSRLKQNPNQPDLLLLIAQHGLYLKDYGTYLEQLKAKFGNQLTPEQWEIIAFGYWEKQDYGKAAIAYSKAPKTPKNLYRYARGLWLDDKIPDSRIAYKQLINTFPNEIDPQGEDAGFGLLRLSRLSDQKEALVYLDRVITQFPRHAAEALLDKSKLLDQMRSEKSASETRQQLLSQYSESEAAAQLRWELAQQAVKAGNLQVASDWAKQVSLKNPDSEFAPEATFWVGKWAEKIGNSQEAKKAYEYLIVRYPSSYYAWRSAVHLGWPVGDFTTVRPLSPHVEHPEIREVPPAGSKTLQELYALGQNQDAWTLWQTEFKNPMQPSVSEQYTDGLMRMGVGDNLDGIWMLSSLNRRDDPQERSQYLDLKQRPAYWEALYPFPYLETIVNWSKERQLNPVLVTALIRQESRFMPQIKSVVGATGLMQVMPETGADVAKQIKLKDYSLENVNDNINLGTYYLDFTHREYNNNSMLAVASYNAGPGAVSDWLKRFGFQDPDEFVVKIPYPETQGYVKSVFENYWNYLRIYNPDLAQRLQEHSSNYKN